MRKYTALAIATVMLAAMGATVPQMVVKNVSRAEIARPVRGQFSEDVYVSGFVEEAVKSDVTVDFPTVADRVMVSVGDCVEANQVLATVDVNATKSALLNLVESAGALPEEYKKYATVLGNVTISADLLQSYIPTAILSPAAGVVTGLSLTPGGVAAPGGAVCTVSELEHLRIRMSVSESDAEKVTAGANVVFRATATGSQKYAGVVERVFPTATQTLAGLSPQTMVGIYVTPVGNMGSLKPGYTVTGVVRRGEGRSALILPYEAVMQDDEGEYVYVYELFRAKKRYIQTGEELTWGVAVTGGLEPSDAVVSKAGAVSEDGALILPAG